MLQVQEEARDKPDRTLYTKQFTRAESRPMTPVYLCDAQPKGFVASEAFYVVYCERCRHCSVSHPRGLAQLVCCSSCKNAGRVADAIDSRYPPLWKVALLRLRVAAREYFGLDEPQAPNDDRPSSRP